MAKPVSIVSSGGLPVVNVPGALPCTAVGNNAGMPITLVAQGGKPMSIVSTADVEGIQFITAQTGSAVATITWDNTPEQAGDFCLVCGGNNGASTVTATAPLVLLRGTPVTQTGLCVAYMPALLTGSDALTLSATFTRLRGTCWRGASRVVDYKINDSTTAGSNTNVPGVAVTIGDPNCVLYDFLYCETAGLTISGATDTQISAQTSGASWRDGRSSPGNVATVTPPTLTISGAGGPWVRIMVAIR